MNRKADTCNWGHITAALLMLLALAWLTVSTPFVYKAQQELAAKKCAAESNQKLIAGTSEEKTEGGTGSVSEFLHEMLSIGHAIAPVVKYEKCHPSDLYLAYHPDLLCPPPDVVG